MWAEAIFLNLLLVNQWQLEYQEMTFGPGDTLLYFSNHIHRVPNLEWKLWGRAAGFGGGGGGSLEARHREESLTTFPRDPSGVIHKRDSNNNGKRRGLNVSCDHMLIWQPQCLPTSRPGQLYEEVHGVRAHMVWVWLCVKLGGKKGPGKRNPPILTSCFCWKGDLSARRAHQHRAQCSPSSQTDSMFMHGTPHHMKSACQHPEG